jgi:transcription initiation factor TFIIB
MDLTDNIDINNFDQLDNLDDEKLWDILDNFSNDNTTKEREKERDQQILQSKNKYDVCCVECKSKNLIYTSGRSSYVCGECGTESAEVFDETPEWNNYEDGKQESGRCGAPINAFFPKSSLGTTISTPGYSKVKMLRNWGQVPYRERSLAEVLNDIDGKCRKHKITKAVIDNAKILYKNIRETKHETGSNKGKNVIIRGINRRQIIAACFYFGAILQKSPRSTKEVADIFNLDLKQITKGCRRFLEIMKDNFIVFDIKPSHGSDFIERFGSKLQLNKETIQLAKTISENCNKIDIASDHQATSVAAASILLAANMLDQQINKKAISEIFKISDVTITKTYKKIYPYQNIIASDQLTTKIYHKMNLKYMTDGFADDNMSEIADTESDTFDNLNMANRVLPNEKSQTEQTQISTESETDILIKKIYAKTNISDTIINNSDNNTTEQSSQIDLSQIDESDIIKKNNNLSKKLKLEQQQKDKERKRLEKLKLKEDKQREAKIEKELNKQKKQLEKIQNQATSTESETAKKKRGRPRKNQITVSNITSI